MQTSASNGDRRGVYYAAAVAVLLLLGGVVFTVLGVVGTAAPTAAPTAAAESAAPESTRSATPERPRAIGGNRERGGGTRSAERPDFGKVLAGSAPVGVTIPRIGVRATRFVGLGLADNGEIEVPRDADTPGWFTPGPSPGQLGPAVIAGHVDSLTGPAVFYRLSELQPGDLVEVDRRDGSKATFSVDRVVSFEKADFPTRAVYGPTSRAELRLITCGGQYDEQTGYLGNTVVFAHLV